ncbi:hypothetical protein [Streptomyces sp. MS1.AVA.4]|uniref:Uncharacterized protein n=1 Tax=Streptomyces pratisoli TaxID=3139917 RepID=A0ACC6QJX3_9ACTN
MASSVVNWQAASLCWGRGLRLDEGDGRAMRNATGGAAPRKGRVKRAMVAACAMAAVAGGGLIAAPAVHADGAGGDQRANPGQVFDGTFRAGDNQTQFIGSCFTARGSATFGGPRHTDCGVDRVTYNVTGEAFRTNRAQHTYIGNVIDVRGGSVTLAGGVYEGNRIIADRILILGNAVLVGGNQLEGEVEVANPDSVAGEFYTDRVVTDDIQRIADGLNEAERATGWFLSEAEFNRLDTEGEIGGQGPDGRVGLHNVLAATGSQDEYGNQARVLARNDSSLFSAVVTANGPRDPDEEDPTATREDFQLLNSHIRECREEMERTFPQGAGAALNALLACSSRSTTAATLVDDVNDRLESSRR